ncbi:MAG: hypothetical protein BWY44_01220 [Candidatus Omnitrophica bacterium ADurb.Bin292]|nr:MAG: hypothetical protein BWY44_01220 [Candidatus Omnitrophica bacterium ADurb.Bin292]
MEEAEKIEPRGIGGWLGLYVYLGIIGGIVGFFVVVMSFIVPLTPQPIFQNIIYLITSILDIWICFRILKLKANAIHYARIYLIAQLILWGLLSAVALVAFLFSLLAGKNYLRPGLEMDSLFGEALSSWIWLMYFIKSVRVRNTFPDKFEWRLSKRFSNIMDWLGAFLIVAALGSFTYAQYIKNQIKKYTVAYMREQGVNNFVEMWKIQTGETEKILEYAFKSMQESRKEDES